MLQGLFFGRVAPPRPSARKIDERTLVIGHPRDPVHPFSDSDMLVRELPNARLVEASSMLELRLDARAADRRDRGLRGGVLVTAKAEQVTRHAPHQRHAG